MSKNSTISLLNETYDLDAKMNWQLFCAENELAYIEGEWNPGDPIFDQAISSINGNCHRQMFNIVVEDVEEYLLGYMSTCPDCGAMWNDEWRKEVRPCWMCAEPAPSVWGAVTMSEEETFNASGLSSNFREPRPAAHDMPMPDALIDTSTWIQREMRIALTVELNRAFEREILGELGGSRLRGLVSDVGITDETVVYVDVYQAYRRAVFAELDREVAAEVDRSRTDYREVHCDLTGDAARMPLETMDGCEITVPISATMSELVDESEGDQDAP